MTKVDQADLAAIVGACRALHASIDGFDQRTADMIGISRADLRCLNLLEQGPMQPTHIANALRLTTGSVTSLIDRLESKDLVTRSRDPNDRRGVLVHATPKVFETVGTLYRECTEALVKVISGYPTNDRAVALRTLGDVEAIWRRTGGDDQIS